jgi:hypothetical protein
MWKTIAAACGILLLGVAAVAGVIEGIDTVDKEPHQILVDTNGNLITNQSTSYPGNSRVQDGDSTVLADVETAHANNKASTLNALNVASFLYGYDGTTFDLVLQTAAGDALGGTAVGLQTLAFNLFYDGTNMRRWLGTAQNSDAVEATVVAPYVSAFNMAYQLDSTKWARIQGETADGGAIAVTADAIYSLALGYVFDGTDWAPLGADSNGDLTVNQTTSTPGYSRIQDNDSTDLVNATSNALDINIAGQTLTAVVISATAAANTLGNPIFTQISQDGTNAVAAAYPLPISQDMSANALNNPIYIELSDGTNAFLDTTSYPGYFRIQDNNSTDLVNLTSNALDVNVAAPLGTLGAASSVATAPPSDSYYMVSKTAAANAVNNTLHVELSDGTNAFFDNTSSPGYIRQQDGDSTVLTDVVDAGSDNMANTLNGPVCHAWGYTWDGSNWDRLQGSGGGMNVNIISPLGTLGAASSVATAPASDAYYMVSKTAAANAANNALHVQISQDGTNSVDATHPVPVSATMAANAVGNPLYCAVSDDSATNAINNPMYFQMSQDGTNAVDATHPIPISATMAANAVANPIFASVSATGAANTLGNPMFFQISADGTNAMDATHPLVISATAAANATANRIFVTSNVDQIAGSATNVNGGTIDAGTQTITIATDDEINDDIDAIKTSVELIDNTYTAGTTSLRTEEIDPLDQKLGSSTLADVTDGADGTYYYYVDKEGFRYEGIQATLDGGSGTVTVTIECSIQDDGTAQASCSYVDVNTSVAGVANWTATFLFTDNDQKLAACKYVRYKVVAATAAADDADWTLFHKKWF